MSQCECVSAGVPRDIIDLFTPLYEAVGGRLYRLQITSSAAAVLMGDGVSVETRVNSLERALLANTTTYFADTIAGRDSVAPLTAGDRCYVFDASADDTVPKGSAMYIWLPSRKWHKLYNGDSPVEAQNLISAGGGLAVQENKLYVRVADLLKAGAGLKEEGGLIAVDAAKLCGAGLDTDSQGRLSVKVGSLPEAQLAELAAALIKAAGGLALQDGKLAVNAADLLKAAGGLKAEGGKLAVDFAQLPAADLAGLAAGMARPGGGLTSGADGKLSVDFSSMPAATLRAMVLPMIRTGGGLKVDSEGKIYFDPTDMDTTFIDKMLKALHLQKWLTKNTAFYVDKSHASASDSIVEGRGLSMDLPFKTIQACLDHVCGDYNFGPYLCAVYINEGVYEEYINLPSYNATSGSLTLRPYDFETGSRVTIRNPDGKNNYLCNVQGAQNYSLYLLNLELAINPALITARSWGAPLRCAAAANVNLYGCAFDVKFQAGALPSGGSAIFYNIIASGGANIRLMHLTTAPTQITAPATLPTGAQGYMFYIDNADLGFASLYESSNNHKIICGGKFSIVMHALNKAMVHHVGGSASFFQFEEQSGNPVTGCRYDVRTGACVNSGGQGPEYFPGSTAGVVQASSYSSYL